jgi:hypothetical protein
MIEDGFHFKFTQNRRTASSFISMPSLGPCGTGMKPPTSIGTDCVIHYELHKISFLSYLQEQRFDTAGEQARTVSLPLCLVA